MIVTLNSMVALKNQWQGVVQMRERMDHLVLTTFAFDPITSPIFGNILYNLPLLLAFDVLKQVLLQTNERDQSTDFQHQLGDLMDSTKASLAWIDWQSLREGVERLTEVQYGGKLLGDKQCLQDIEHVESQLVAWGVITPV